MKDLILRFAKNIKNIQAPILLLNSIHKISILKKSLTVILDWMLV
jgi:hypothetical protein